jgi:hypothetical protein
MVHQLRQPLLVAFRGIFEAFGPAKARNGGNSEGSLCRLPFHRRQTQLLPELETRRAKHDDSLSLRSLTTLPYFDSAANASASRFISSGPAA